MAVRLLLLSGSFLATVMLFATPEEAFPFLTIASHHPWNTQRPTRRSIQQGDAVRRQPGGGGGTCHGATT